MADPVKTVMVVDDDPHARNTLARLLRREGYPVAAAANGAEALKLLRDGPVGLVILDLLMPVLDGWTFCKLLRGDPATAGLPIIVSSGAPPALQGSGGLPLNVQGFQPKPIDPEALLAAVHRHCAGGGVLIWRIRIKPRKNLRLKLGHYRAGAEVDDRDGGR